MLTHQVWMPEGGVVIEVCPSLEPSSKLERMKKRERRENADMERVNQLFPNESFLPEHQIVADVLSHEYIPVVRACFSSSVPCFLLIYSNSQAEINPFSSILILQKCLRTLTNPNLLIKHSLTTSTTPTLSILSIQSHLYLDLFHNLFRIHLRAVV